MNKLNPIPDKIYVAPDGRFVGAADVAHQIECKCPYVSQVVLAGKSDKEMSAVIFAKTAKFSVEDITLRKKGCYCPANMAGLGRCLSECMDEVNESISGLRTRISNFALVPHEADGKPATHHDAQERVIRRYEDCLEHGHSNVEGVVMVQMLN
jgi:hypothetical protein